MEKEQNTFQGWLAIHLAGVEHGRISEHNARLRRSRGQIDLGPGRKQHLIRSTPPSWRSIAVPMELKSR